MNFGALIGCTVASPAYAVRMRSMPTGVTESVWTNLSRGIGRRIFVAGTGEVINGLAVPRFVRESCISAYTNKGGISNLHGR